MEKHSPRLATKDARRQAYFAWNAFHCCEKEGCDECNSPTRTDPAIVVVIEVLADPPWPLSCCPKYFAGNFPPSAGFFAVAGVSSSTCALVRLEGVLRSSAGVHPLVSSPSATDVSKRRLNRLYMS